jgi:WD40 repeat protein
MRTLASLDSPISSLVVSPDGSMVVTSSSEGIGFLDLSSGQRSVTALDEEVSRLAWGPDGLLAGTSTGEVWSVGDAPARLFEAIDEEISGIAATIDGTIAVCGGEPFAVATFGPHGNEEWRGEPDKWPYCVRFSPDGKLLAVATWDGYLFVFDAHDLPDELDNGDGEPAGGPIFDVRFLPGDRVLVVGASFVRVWDRGAGSYTSSRELDAEAFAVAVAPDGSCAVVSTNDQRLRLFALPELGELGQLSSGNKVGKALSSFPDYAEFCHVKGPATIRSLAFHPDGTRLFGATEDRRIVEVARAELQQVAVRVAAPPARVRVEPAPPKVAPARAASAGKSIVKKTAAKKTAAKNAAARNKKPAARKPAVRKAAARKPAARKPAARKASKKAAQRRSGR